MLIGWHGPGSPVFRWPARNIRGAVGRCTGVAVTNAIRRRIGAGVIERVVGPPDPDPDPAARPRIEEADRWFAADRPIRRVPTECAAFVGGISALLMQSPHPLA